MAYRTPSSVAIGPSYPHLNNHHDVEGRSLDVFKVSQGYEFEVKNETVILTQFQVNELVKFLIEEIKA